MDLYESLQLQAMRAVDKPSDDDYLDRAFRYYSKNFFTPLSAVRDLPIEDVLYTYFVDCFDNMDKEDREEKIEWLLMSPEERLKHKNVEGSLVSKDDEFLEQLNKEVTEGETIKRAKPKGNQKVEKKDETIPNHVQQLTKMIERTKQRAAKLGGAQLPKPKSKPATLGELPEINMSFGLSNNLSKWDTLDPLAPPKKK